MKTGQPPLPPTIPETAPVSARGLFLVVFHKDGMKAHPLPPGRPLTVGRDPKCDVRIDSPALSRVHLAVHATESPTVEDLGSANGTKLSGRRIAANTPCLVALGETIHAGGIFFMVHDHDPRERFGASAQWTAVSPDAQATAGPLPGVITSDPSSVQLFDLVKLVARSNLPILVTGETGVGKEVVAESVHRWSMRAQKPYVRLNCAALPEQLLESELFGFERGAFTGANQTKPGLIESADGGTLFLDEIGEVPMVTQPKLLRVLESGEILRIGALKSRHVDVRFVAATNRDLPRLVTRGLFRRDLYFRLNGITIPVRPLRERLSEVVPLAKLFLEQAAKRAGQKSPEMSRAIGAVLTSHSWPGNARELRNVMERALAVGGGRTLRTEHILLDPELPPSEREPEGVATRAPNAPGIRRLTRIDPDVERKMIVDALERSGGNQSKASELLGVSRRTLIHRLEEYEITRPRKKTDP